MKNIKVTKVKGSNDVVLSIRFDPNSRIQDFLATLVNYAPIVDWKSEFDDFCEELRDTLEQKTQADMHQTQKLEDFIAAWLKSRTIKI